MEERVKKGLKTKPVLADDKMLDLSKSKAFADDKLNVTQNIKVVFQRSFNG